MSKQKTIDNYKNKTSLKDTYTQILEREFGIANAEELIEDTNQFLEIIKRKQNKWYHIRSMIEHYVELENTEVNIEGENRNFAEYKVYRTKDSTQAFYMTDFWRSRRQKILKRDGFKCQNCGLTMEEQKEISPQDNGLEVHHIKKRLSFDWDEQREHGNAHDSKNLVVLCRDCHPRFERKTVEQQKEELNIT